MSERALVTGGAGFIGSHLADRLLSEGYHVQVIDDLSTGSMSNIAHHGGDRRFCYTIDTVLNAPLMQQMIDGCDLVFHLAAAVGVDYVIRNQVKSIQVNVRGTETVLDCASRSRKKVVVFSSSEIYGKSARVPFNEDDDSILGSTTVTRWGYAVSKALDEIMALAYWRERGLPIVIVRCFNTCGPRQTGRYGMVLPRFVEQALTGRPITVFGDGTQTRCFASVYDVVEGICSLARLERAVGEIFNIGSDDEVTVTRLAEEVRRVAGSDSPIEYVPYAEAYGDGFEDMMRRVPDLSRIRSYIGYQTKYGLADIIRSVIDHIKPATSPK